MSKQSGVFIAVLICLFAPFLLYLNTLNHPFIFDDLANIVYNPDIKDLSSLKNRLIYQSSYGLGQNDPSRPFTYFTYTLNYFFGQMNPFGYHLVNVLIHMGNTVLIYFLTQILFFLFYKVRLFFVPLLVALVFACHPLQIEVVTYISGRADGLATFFYLFSIFFFLNLIFSQRKRIFYFLSLISFVFSFWSKQIGVTLPLMILILEFFLDSDGSSPVFLSNEGNRSNSFWQKIGERNFYHLGFWLLLGIFLIFRYFYFGGLGDRITDPWERWTRLTYALTQPFVILNYSRLLLAPRGQSIDHFIEPAKSILEFRTFISILVLGSSLGAVVYFFKKNWQYSKMIFFGMIWFFLTLSPTSSFFPINDAMTERRLYLPSFGFILCGVSFCLMIFKVPIKENFKDKSFLKLSICLVVFIFAGLTLKRNRFYENPIVLWQEAVQLYPKNARAQYNLGNHTLRVGELDQASSYFENALQINPKLAEPHNNLGLIYLQKKELKKAEESFQKALLIKPGLMVARQNLEKLKLSQERKNKIKYK
ncbi:MAG: tetratricopeptide repeat protein [Elusimicrobia bacterium]|nr:tetratricopeptide repeat protein [Elusimicrobiota bacterium]